jgi:hypothetical protein
MFAKFLVLQNFNHWFLTFKKEGFSLGQTNNSFRLRLTSKEAAEPQLMSLYALITLSAELINVISDGNGRKVNYQSEENCQLKFNSDALLISLRTDKALNPNSQLPCTSCLWKVHLSL